MVFFVSLGSVCCVVLGLFLLGWFFYLFGWVCAVNVADCSSCVQGCGLRECAFAAWGRWGRLQRLPGGVKFPAVDPPAVGADISVGARLCCLIEMQMRTFLGLESSDFTRSEVTQVWSLRVFQQYFLMPHSKPYWNIWMLLCSVAMSVSFPLVKLLHTFQ